MNPRKPNSRLLNMKSQAHNMEKNMLIASLKSHGHYGGTNVDDVLRLVRFEELCKEMEDARS